VQTTLRSHILQAVAAALVQLAQAGLGHNLALAALVRQIR
jgi:hypothetical protein